MTLPTMQNQIFVSNGSHSHGFSTAEYYRRLQGLAYPSATMMKELFPTDWKITDLTVDVKEFEDVIVTVTRVLDSSSSLDVLKDLHHEMVQHVSGIVLNYKSGVETAEYKMFMNQNFYCERIPQLHKQIYEEQFHKDFENVDSKQV